MTKLLRGGVLEHYRVTGARLQYDVDHGGGNKGKWCEVSVDKEHAAGTVVGLGETAMGTFSMGLFHPAVGTGTGSRSGSGSGSVNIVGRDHATCDLSDPSTIPAYATTELYSWLLSHVKKT